MPKSFLLESIRHHLLSALKRTRMAVPPKHRQAWGEVSRTLDIRRGKDRTLVARWRRPQPGSVVFKGNVFKLYQRGDLPAKNPSSDPARTNAEMAETIVARIATASGLPQPSKSDSRLDQEEIFHDQWAGEVSPEEVRVRESFEAVTAPENRYILSLLGDLGGKRVLDLGCGLGEASVYFATKGALVTACDLSLGMLDITSQVAACHGVSVTLHRGAADRTGLAESSFDIVYSANLLHHVDAAAALDEIHRVLATGGIFVTWDPLGHNPIIDVYRRMAKSVRTLGEQPLRMGDLELFQSRFRDVRWRCFWLLTQAIFIRFYLWEKTHPSKERYWKKILTDAERISKFYQRLESLDHRILNAFPWLGRYCWNILVWGRK